MEPSYVTGFVDGQGSFTYSRSGRQLALYFVVKVGPDNRGILQELQAYFQGAGTIYDLAHGAAVYRVTHRHDLAIIVEHFDAYPLRTSKRASYEIWRQMVMLKREFRAPDRARLDALADQLSRRRTAA